MHRQSTTGPAIYIGGHLGGGYGEFVVERSVHAAGNNNFNNWGFLGGAQVGANVQFNRLVLGVEGDFSWTNIKNKGTDSIGDTLNTNVPWTSTVTGRVGAAFDRLLVYGKGGLALAEGQEQLTDLAGSSASTSLLRTGWTRRRRDLNTPSTATGRPRSNTTIWALARRR